MDEIIQLLKDSLQDKVFSRSEKREIKERILNKNFSKREFDYLRSQIFDLAKENIANLSKENLIDWIEETNKLTLLGKDETNSSAAYFSPGTSCKSAIISQIRKARSSIKICVFTISDNEISKEIIAAHRRKISVKVITDNDKSFDRGSDIETIFKSGVPLKIDQTDDHMHHKFCIIDKQLLLSGSYNWTRSAAERNHENILLTEESSVVKAFLGEFDSLWNQLVDYK